MAQGNKTAKGKGKTRGDVAPKVRFIVDNAIEKLGIQKCIQMLADEIEEHGFSTTIPKLSQYFPKEMDITTTNLTPEQWLEEMADGRQSESTEPANTIPRPVH
jgi:hypothetical protein